MIGAHRDDNSRTNLKRRVEYVRYILNGPKEYFRRVFELRVPGKFNLLGRQLVLSVSVILNLCFKFHLTDMRNEARPGLVSELSEVLMKGVSLNKSDFGVEVRTDVFVNGNEAPQVILEAGINSA